MTKVLFGVVLNILPIIISFVALYFAYKSNSITRSISEKTWHKNQIGLCVGNCINVADDIKAEFLYKISIIKELNDSGTTRSFILKQSDIKMKTLFQKLNVGVSGLCNCIPEKDKNSLDRYNIEFRKAVTINNFMSELVPKEKDVDYNKFIDSYGKLIKEISQHNQ